MDILLGGTINQYRLDQEDKVDLWIKGIWWISGLREAVQFISQSKINDTIEILDSSNFNWQRTPLYRDTDDMIVKFPAD